MLEGCHKIGRSVDPDGRLNSYAPLLPVPLSILHTIETENQVWLESFLHKALAEHRVRGEWFRLPGDILALLNAISVASSPFDMPAEIIAMHAKYKKKAPKPIVKLAVQPAIEQPAERPIDPPRERKPEPDDSIEFINEPDGSCETIIVKGPVRFSGVVVPLGTWTTVAGIVKKHRISKARVCKFIKRGRLRHTKISTQVVVDADHATEFFAIPRKAGRPKR